MAGAKAEKKSRAFAEKTNRSYYLFSHLAEAAVNKTSGDSISPKGSSPIKQKMMLDILYSLWGTMPKRVDANKTRDYHRD